MAYQSGKTPPSSRLGMITNLIRDGRLAWRLLSDPRMGTVAKIVIPILAVLYVLSPIDLLPDVVPLVGQLDDLAIIALAMRLFIGMAPPSVVAEYRAEMAGQPAGQTAEQTAEQMAGTQRSAGKKTAKEEVIEGDYRVMR